METTSGLLQITKRCFELNDGKTGDRYLEQLRGVVADEMYRWEGRDLEWEADGAEPQMAGSKKRAATETVEERDGKRARLEENEEDLNA